MGAAKELAACIRPTRSLRLGPPSQAPRFSCATSLQALLDASSPHATPGQGTRVKSSLPGARGDYAEVNYFSQALGNVQSPRTGAFAND